MLWLPKTVVNDCASDRLVATDTDMDDYGSAPAPHASQHRPRFFDQRCASKDYDGCDDADGLKRVRVSRQAMRR